MDCISLYGFLAWCELDVSHLGSNQWSIFDVRGISVDSNEKNKMETLAASLCDGGRSLCLCHLPSRYIGTSWNNVCSDVHRNFYGCTFLECIDTAFHTIISGCIFGSDCCLYANIAICAAKSKGTSFGIGLSERFLCCNIFAADSLYSQSFCVRL